MATTQTALRASGTEAAASYSALVAGAVKPYGQAILASTKSIDGAAVTEKFAMPSQALGMLSDKLNENNPLAFFTSGLQVASTGVGSVELKWTDEGTFVEKVAYGEGDFNDVNIDRETIYWNKPGKIAEAMTAYDLSKGTPNVLAERLYKHTVRFSQGSIKRAFEAVVKTVGLPAVEITKPTTGSVQEKGAELLLALTNAAVAMVNKAEISKEEVTIVIDALLFNELAFAGLLGNRTDVTFAGGQYSVTTVGGFRIVSGEMFMPAGTFGVTDGKIVASGTDKASAFIGTNDSLVHNMQIVAANTGSIGISNDLGTYLEVADIAAVPKHTVLKGYLEVVVVK